MVDISPEEVMEQRKSAKAMEDLSPREREIVGGTVRLDLPMDSQYRLRQVAECLRDLAKKLDALSRTNALTPVQACIEASAQAFFTRRDIMKLEGRQLRYPRVRKSRIFGKLKTEN
jgi:hypothetical protein